MPQTVTVFVLSPNTRSERRFDLHTTVGQLKARLELITGIPEENQSIQLCDTEEDAAPVAVLDDNSRPLGFYSVHDKQVLKIVDTDPSSSITGRLQNTENVEKFELTNEQYEKRQDSVLAYKQRNKIGRFADPAESQEKAPVAPVNIPIGSRCEVETTEPGLHKRGTVRFVGPTKFAPAGQWIGIEYDEPMGKNDGTVQGERYFTCKPNYGVFVRPEKVTVGDFPVIDEFDMGEEEEI